MLVPVALNPFPTAFWHLYGRSLWQDFRTHLWCVEPGPAALPLVLPQSLPPAGLQASPYTGLLSNRNASEAEEMRV